jgi:hypothetical protein
MGRAIFVRTLGIHTFRVSQLGGTMYMLVVGAMPFLLPLEFQVQYGWSPIKSGAVAAFVFAGNVGIKPATTPLINRFGFRSVLVVSALGTAVIVAAIGFTTAATPVALIAALALASGITRSTGFTLPARAGRGRLRGRGAPAGPHGRRRRQAPPRRRPCGQVKRWPGEAVARAQLLLMTHL